MVVCTVHAWFLLLVNKSEIQGEAGPTGTTHEGNAGWSVLPRKPEKMVFIPVTPCVTPIHTRATPCSLIEDPEQQGGTFLLLLHHVAFFLELSLPITIPLARSPAPLSPALTLGDYH